MLAQQFSLRALSPAPSGHVPKVRRAHRYLVATHASESGLIDSFNVVHEATVSKRTNAQGRLPRDEVDLVRAALVFTSSGLDASRQTLVAECLPELVEKAGSTAAKKFDVYLDEHFLNPTSGFKAAVKGPEPSTELVRLYVEAKTKSSYQGSGDVRSRVRDLLGIPNSVVPTARINALDGFFRARNDIVHQLDYVDPRSTSVARQSRSPADVVAECDLVLAVIADLISAAARVMRSK